MSNATKLNAEKHLSARYIIIKRYQDNKTAIAMLTKQNDLIKEQWKHSGSFATRNFVVSIKKSRFKKAPNKEELFYMLGDGAEKLLVNKTRTDFIVEER